MPFYLQPNEPKKNVELDINVELVCTNTIFTSNFGMIFFKALGFFDVWTTPSRILWSPVAFAHIITETRSLFGLKPEGLEPTSARVRTGNIL